MKKIIQLAKLLKKLSFDEESEEVEGLIEEDKDLPEEPEDVEEPSIEEKYFNLSRDRISNFAAEAQKEYDTFGYRTEWNVLYRYPEFEYYGKGAFRFAFGINNNPEYILKIAKLDTGEKMNQLEFELQLRFEDLFPKVYMHGKGLGSDFDWLLIEKVRVIRERKEADKFFPILMSLINSADLSMVKEDREFFDGTALDFLFLLFEFSSELNDSKETLESMFKMPINDIKKEALKDPLAYKMIRLVNELDIELSDINEGNVGINSKGNFVIIDASIF